MVMGISIFTAFIWLDKMPIGNHEAYVAVAAKQMTATGNWVIPYFNGKPRLQKTPLCYWILAAISNITGEMNDFIVRLPSAIMAVLSTAAILYFVSERLGLRTAAVCAFIWATSIGYIRFSHTGRPEMTLCTFVAIAMLSFYSGLKAETRNKQICCCLVFWISFSLAMLTKGPAPLPLIIPALFLYFLVFRQWKYVPKILPIAGTILFLLIVLPWPIAVLKNLSSAVEIWHREFIERAEGKYAAGGKAVYYYFEVMFVYIAPYCALIPLALSAPFFKIWQEKRDALWYHWFWFVAGIIVMTACGGKRQHYILPLMPAMAVMGGIILDDMLFLRKAYDKKFVRNFLLGHLITILIGGTAFLIINPKLESREVHENNVTKKFVSEIKTKTNNIDIIAYCKANASFIYYLGRDVPEFADFNEVYNLYSQGKGVLGLDGRYEEMKKDLRFNLYINGPDNERGLFLKTE